MKDYYKILELEFGAELSEIKKAYRRLALKFHPDKNNSPDASWMFIEITEAYEVLRDPAEREKYDEMYIAYFYTQSHHSSFDVFTESVKNWKATGETRADEYAHMKYEDFARRLSEEIKIGIGYLPNLIFILICFALAVTTFIGLIDIEPIMAVLAILVFGGAGIALLIRANEDYTTERKSKITNK